MPSTQKDSVNIGPLLPNEGGGADQSERIHPIPHSSRPENDPVVAADAGQHSLHAPDTVGSWSTIGNAEGNHPEQALEHGVGLVVRAIDPTRSGQHTEPETALRFARTQEEVAVGEVVL